MSAVYGIRKQCSQDGHRDNDRCPVGGGGNDVEQWRERIQQRIVMRYDVIGCGNDIENIEGMVQEFCVFISGRIKVV